MKKRSKTLWLRIAMLVVLSWMLAMLAFEIWQHDAAGIISNSCYIVAWVQWFRVFNLMEDAMKANDALSDIVSGLMADLADKRSKGMTVDKLVWRKAKAGYKFDSDAIVIGLGEDKDPRLVRCAVNDCSYILVKDLIEKLPVIEETDAAK